MATHTVQHLSIFPPVGDQISINEANVMTTRVVIPSAAYTLSLTCDIKGDAADYVSVIKAHAARCAHMHSQFEWPTTTIHPITSSGKYILKT